jgi:hypothetical protein
MGSRIISKQFRVEGVLTDPTSIVLSDATGTYGVKRNDTNAVVVADGTAMTKVSTGIYSYTFTEPAAGLSYTSWIEIVYGGATYYVEEDIPAYTATAGTCHLTCNYQSLVNEIGRESFGLRPTSSDVISDGIASTDQASDILQAIAKGLHYVYAVHNWRFLRPRVTITTKAAYSTGTITVSAGGTVTGSGTTFPSYAASAGGVLYIPSVGSFAVATYVSGISLTLTDYTGGAITTATTYRLGFNTYPMPSGVETLEGRLSYPENFDQSENPLVKVSEEEVRIALMRNNTPSRPSRYTEVMDTFVPTVGSTRSLVLYPVPDASYVLTAIGVAKIPTIDATNQYPLGGDVLSAVISESCLAAAEREIAGKDGTNPDAVHNRALVPLLAVAIQRDKERGSPDTLGVDYGQEAVFADRYPLHRCDGRILWNAGAGFSGWI